MEKRLFIAILISIGFLWAWGMVAPKLFPELAKKKPAESSTETVETTSTAGDPDGDTVEDAQATEPVIEDRAQPEPARATGSVTPIRASREETVVVENDHVRASFSNRGAVLRSLHLKGYAGEASDGKVELIRERPEDLPYPFAIRSGSNSFNDFASNSLYEVNRSQGAAGETIRFTARDEAGRAVTKSFVFNKEEAFGYEITTEGLNEPYRMVIGPGIGRTGAVMDDRFAMSGNVVVEADGDYEMIKRKKVDSFMTIDQPKFIGLSDHYFVTALLPERSGAATVRPVEIATGKEGEAAIKELYVGVNAVDGEVSGRAFFGPKEAKVLERYGLSETLQIGIFGVIAKFLLKALVWINSFTHNFGWSIVLLTIMIKLVLYPLQHKSIVSMKRMQKVQPKMNAIRDKYRKAKTDPQQKQKMNMDMMELYKREGINPMSGCLPILLQLPILWAFYTLLSHAIELRGEPWILWITDLSAKDPYYITPILMTITMFVQQYITPTAADPMQRKIFLAMPIVFGWIFKEFPSGLVLYWLVQNLLTITQQSLMNKWWKEHPESLERGTAT